MLAKKRCREVPRCKFQSEMFEAVKAFERKNMFSQNRCILRLEFMCKWKIGTKMAHIQIYPNYVKMSTHRTLCFILQALNYVCIYMVQNCTWHLFHQSKGVQTQGRCSPFFPFFPSRCHPETAETAEALNRRALGGKHNSDSSGDASVHEQPTLQQGKLRPGWGLWGERWPSWTFHQGIFWFGQGLKRGFSFCFPVLLDDFWAN